MSSFTSKFKSTPTFSFKSRTSSLTSSNHPDKFPSPNHYNPEKKSIQNSPSIHFAQAQRAEWKEVKQKNETPGPGTHQSKSYITDGPKKSISKFKHKQKINQNPSPGVYNNDSIILKSKGPSFSIQSKSMSSDEILKKMNSYKPSPDSYQKQQNILTKFRSGSQFSIGTAKRSVNLKIESKTPGPGDYSPEASFVKSISTSSKCRLAKAVRKIDFSIGEKSPGPGTYKKNSFIEENQKRNRGFSCRQKTGIRNPIIKNPGPGAYESPLQHKYRSSPLLKIPQSSRPCFTDRASKKSNQLPGPGSHQIEQYAVNNKFRSLSVHKFSKQKKTQIPKKDLVKLSPFSYKVNNSLLDKRTPSYSIDRRQKKGLKLQKMGKSPGPGDYNSSSNLINKSELVHRMPVAQRPNMIRHLMQNPGPGQYLYEEQQLKGKKFKFSKAPRININDEKIKKSKSTITESYEAREVFPNPPRYMGVEPRIKFNEKIMKKY